MQASWWIVGGALTLAIVSALGDHRRVRRTNPDAVGWVPWPMILVLSLGVAGVAAAIALGR